MDGRYMTQAHRFPARAGPERKTTSRISRIPVVASTRRPAWRLAFSPVD